MTATDDEEAAPTSGEDAMFRAMFGDLMAEARAGRLTQREFQAACMARMASMPCNAQDPRNPGGVDNSAAARDAMRVETGLEGRDVVRATGDVAARHRVDDLPGAKACKHVLAGMMRPDAPAADKGHLAGIALVLFQSGTVRPRHLQPQDIAVEGVHLGNLLGGKVDVVQREFHLRASLGSERTMRAPDCP